MLMMRDTDAMNTMKGQKQRIQQHQVRHLLRAARWWVCVCVDVCDQDNIAYWRTKLQNNVRECEERNKALREVCLSLSPSLVVSVTHSHGIGRRRRRCSGISRRSSSAWWCSASRSRSA
jgi:hypothetical protein